MRVALRVLPGVALAASVIAAGAWATRDQAIGEHVVAARAEVDAQASSSSSSSSTTVTAPAASTDDAPADAALQSSPEATTACERRLDQHASADNPWQVTLVASQAATTSDVAAAEERRRGPSFRSPWRDRSATEPVAVCWFDATGFGVAPGYTGSDRRPTSVVTRLQEVVRADGVPIVFAAGRRETLKVAAIEAAGAAR